MSVIPTLFIVIAVQQLAFAGMWVGMAWQGLARKASLHWAGACVLIAVSASLVAARGQLHPWVGYVLGNAALLLGLLLLRHGLCRFLRQGARLRTAAWAVLVYVVLMTLLERSGRAWLVPPLSAMLWSLMLGQMAWRIACGLRSEFGPVLAYLCAVPMGGVALVFIPRVLLLLTSPAAAAQPSPSTQAVALVVAIGMCAGMLVMNLVLVALVMARALMRLRQLSERDALTGLLNRRTIEARLAAEAQRAARYGGAFALLSIDIDHFKRINDTLGHPAGDQVLREVAATLRGLARQVDTVARVGGEEFWVLLPATRAEGALPLAERMRAHIGSAVSQASTTPLRTTVSIGVAVADQPTEPVDALLRRLDAALYQAKREGRDRVALAPPAPPLSPMPPAPPPVGGATPAATR